MKKLNEETKTLLSTLSFIIGSEATNPSASSIIQFRKGFIDNISVRGGYDENERGYLNNLRRIYKAELMTQYTHDAYE